MVQQLECKQCGAVMRRTTKSERNMGMQVLGILVFLVGLMLLFVVPIGTVIGILLMLAALGMGYKKRKVWKCTSCGYFFERT